MTEDQATYGERHGEPSQARQAADMATLLTTALPIRRHQIPAIAGHLAAIAAASSRPITDITIGELVTSAQGGWCAVGKHNGIWHALGVGPHPAHIRIGNGRRRTLTARQLAGAARFETALLARRAGRAAGFARTYALPFPVTHG